MLIESITDIFSNENMARLLYVWDVVGAISTHGSTEARLSG